MPGLFVTQVAARRIARDPKLPRYLSHAHSPSCQHLDFHCLPRLAQIEIPLTESPPTALAQSSFPLPAPASHEALRLSVYYAVIESAGRDNARVTAATAKMQALGKSLILFTAVLAVGQIVRAKDKVKEAARQGSIIAVGMIGGAAAGAAVSFICGPAEPICAVATVAVGSNLGGMAGQVLFDFYQDELNAFNQLMWH